MPLKTKLEVLTKDQLEEVHEASLKILERTGILFDNEEALEILRSHGVKVVGKIAYFTPKIVENALLNCPSTFTWRARNNERNLTVGNGPLLGSMLSAVNAQDIDNGRRPSTLEDLRKILKLHQSSTIMDFVCMSIVEPTDIPAKERHLYLTYETLKNCDKPINAYNILNGTTSIELLNMLEIPFGELKESNHVVSCSVTSSSPLKYERGTLETLIEFARRNQIVIPSPCALSGVSCPINLLGGSVLQNVEALAGIVLVQLINPGAPVVYHVSNNITNMRTATSAWGSPESMLMCIPNFQLAIDFYHLPIRTLAGVTTSKTVDCQASLETMQSVMVSVFSGSHLNYAACGILENVMTYSYEKQMIDEEIYERVKQIHKGLEFSDEALSVDVINEIGHGGSYIMHPSTLENFRSIWEPSVSNWDTHDENKEDVLMNANKLWKKRLEEAPETLLDPELDKELKAFMEKCMK